MGVYVRVSNFIMMLRNKIEKGDWSFVLKVNAYTKIESINVSHVYLRFFSIYNI
jgi:hypothetical protein